ncbi:MAG: hypothetical protein M3Y77_19590 [Actinomycetota bacterium]|nr:hypothetical protein [Actinomycetota bacterium]
MKTRNLEDELGRGLRAEASRLVPDDATPRALTRTAPAPRRWWWRRRPELLIAAVVVALIAVTGGVVLVTRGPAGPSASPPPTSSRASVTHQVVAAPTSATALSSPAPAPVKADPALCQSISTNKQQVPILNLSGKSVGTMTVTNPTDIAHLPDQWCGRFADGTVDASGTTSTLLHQAALTRTKTGLVLWGSVLLADRVVVESSNGTTGTLHPTNSQADSSGASRFAVQLPAGAIGATVTLYEGGTGARVLRQSFGTITVPATDTAIPAVGCVDTSHLTNAVSGAIQAGPFDLNKGQWGNLPDGTKFWVGSTAASDHTDAYLRAEQADGRAAPVEQYRPFFPQPSMTDLGSFYPGGFRLPSAGRWILSVTIGDDTGCFLVAVS